MTITGKSKTGGFDLQVLVHRVLQASRTEAPGMTAPGPEIKPGRGGILAAFVPP